jgi:hypothetical protein
MRKQSQSAWIVATIAERLRLAHAEAVSEIERDREQPGQLTTGINGEVGASILNAGMLALTEEGGGHSPSRQQSSSSSRHHPVQARPRTR